MENWNVSLWRCEFDGTAACHQMAGLGSDFEFCNKEFCERFNRFWFEHGRHVGMVQIVRR